MRNMLLSFIALCIAIPCLADDCIIVTTLSDVLECEDCYEQGGIVYFNFSDKHYGMSKEDILSIEYVTPNEPEFAEKPYSENSQQNKIEIVERDLLLLEDYGGMVIRQCEVSFKVTFKNPTYSTLSFDMKAHFYNSNGFNIASSKSYTIEVPARDEVTVSEHEILMVRWQDIDDWKIYVEY